MIHDGLDCLVNGTRWTWIFSNLSRGPWSLLLRI